MEALEICKRPVVLFDFDGTGRYGSGGDDLDAQDAGCTRVFGGADG